MFIQSKIEIAFDEIKIRKLIACRFCFRHSWAPFWTLTFKTSNYFICFDQNIWNKTDIWFYLVCHVLHLTFTSKFTISWALRYFNPVNGVCNFHYSYTQACLCKHADTAFHKRLKWQKRTYVTATKHTLWQAKTNGIKRVSSTRFHISYICILR